MYRFLVQLNEDYESFYDTENNVSFLIFSKIVLPYAAYDMLQATKSNSNMRWNESLLIQYDISLVWSKNIVVNQEQNPQDKLSKRQNG